MIPSLLVSTDDRGGSHAGLEAAAAIVRRPSDADRPHLLLDDYGQLVLRGRVAHEH